MINRGHHIRFDAQLRLYVHADCAKIRGLVVNQIHRSPRQARVNGLPHGLKPKSLHSYKVEWEKYVRFVQRRGFGTIPGKEEPWDLALLQEYMEWRAQTCKPSTLASSFSVMAHYGAMFGFLLPNSRDDDDSLSYRRIRNMKKQLRIDYVELTGETDEPSRCTPLGCRDVSLLFSAYGVTSRETFEALPRRHRHHLFCALISHAQGLRFGHFVYRSYVVDLFTVELTSGDFLLLTDWHRYEGRQRFCLRFRAFPVESFLWYELRDVNGNVIDTVSAATVMSWHFKKLRQEGEQLVFAPVKGVQTTREQRATWLRESLLAALPEDELAARQLVQDVTPHAFRPGLAGDMRRAGMRLDAISMELRWQGMRNARMYSARTPLSSARQSAKFRLINMC